MKLEVGMYVKTNFRREHVIRKVVNIVEDPLVHDHRLIFDKPTKYNYYVEDNDYIAKENLIELIQAGDYVNGVEVEEINDKWIMLVDNHLWIDKEAANKLIESVVTYEQFENEKYEVR